MFQVDNSPPYVANEDMNLDDPGDNELENEDILSVHLSWLLLILLNGNQLKILKNTGAVKKQKSHHSVSQRAMLAIESICT